MKTTIMTEKSFTPLATNFTHRLGTVEFLNPLEMLIRVNSPKLKRKKVKNTP
jgi:hypothetical protein